MADASVTFLLEQVKEIVKYHAELISTAKTEFDHLKKDLVTLKSNLKDAAEVAEKNESFKRLESRIRESVYIVEDTIDKGLTSAHEAKKKRNVFKPFNLAKQVRSLREENVKPLLQEVQTKFNSMKGADGPSKTTSAGQLPWTKVRKGQVIRQDRVVGFEDQEQILTNYLGEKKEELDVISIIGMPGLGKTTLAWKIFQSEKIHFEFPIRIWVSVSEKFNHKEVFLKILETFTSKDMSHLNDHDLGHTVRECLKNERFLLVMDDVWSVGAWEAIKNILPQKNGKGKVLVTSREKNVGIHANVGREPHMLRFLTEEESWQLLQLEVFGNLNVCSQELKEMGKHIAKHCDGVPLTIVVIGGILVDQSGKKSGVIGLVKKEWEKVAENVNRFLDKDKEKRISKVVELSYSRLPDELRECFLYIGVFPEDHDIPVWTLTRLWIAEGFIHPEQGNSLEDTAEEILYDLISRNLLMVPETGTNPMGEVKICRVHDMIRAFCISKALDQNLFREIRKSKDGVLEPQVSEVDTFHRLCFHSDLSKFLSTTPKGPHVRSFLCFYKDPVNLDKKYASTIPDAFDLLRVLDSRSIRFQQFPVKVAKLIHLRYVTLNVDNLKILPEHMSQLWNLQTVVVETKSREIEMRANIWTMTRMRHLKTKAAIVLDTKRKGEAGENLQTLTTLSPQSFTDDVVRKAHNLKTLGFRGNIATLFNVSSSMSTSLLGKLQRLEKLKLMNELPYESTSEEGLLRLPQPNCFPPNLKRLTLSRASLSWMDLSMLAKISTLEVLKLKENKFNGIEWNTVGDDGFKSLQYLLIARTDLVIWKASPNSFPSLRCLVLRNCEELQEIPGCLAETLEIMKLTRVSDSAVKCARTIEGEKKQAQEQERGKWGVTRFKLSVDTASEKQSN